MNPGAAAPIAGYLTADWHVPEHPGRGQWVGTDVRGDALFALEQVAALCVRDGAALYAAGDLFDGPDPDPGAVAGVYAALRPLAGAGLKVYYILGNHDRGRDWLLPFGPGAVRLTAAPVETPLGPAAGLSYVPPEAFPAAARAVPPVRVGLYHQTWAEFVRGGRTALAALPGHALAVCGDVHVRAAVRSGRARTLAVSPGPLAPQSAAEFAVRPAVYACGPDLTVTEVPLKGRKFMALDVPGPDALARAVRAVSGLAPDPALPPHLARPLVSVRYGWAPAPAEEAEVAAAAAAAGAVLRTYRAVGAAGPGPERAAALGTAASLAAAIEAAAASPGAKALARAAVEAADPAAVLTAARLRAVPAQARDGGVVPCP